MNEHLPVVHQQPDGMPLADFAALHGLDVGQARRLANAGRILGANRLHNGYWFVYPPAKILEGLHAHTRNKRPVSPYRDPRVKESHRVLTLCNLKQSFPVLLTGAQVLFMEQLILRECEKLKRQRLDDDAQDEEQDIRASSSGDKLQCLYAALHVINDAAKQAKQGAQS